MTQRNRQQRNSSPEWGTAMWFHSSLHHICRQKRIRSVEQQYANISILTHWSGISALRIWCNCEATLTETSSDEMAHKCMKKKCEWEPSLLRVEVWAWFISLWLIIRQLALYFQIGQILDSGCISIHNKHLQKEAILLAGSFCIMVYVDWESFH